MSGVRQTYLSAVEVALDLIRRSEVANAWDQPSALEHWLVSGLTGHLARAVTTVEQYLDAETDSEGARSSPGKYFSTVVDTFDIGSELHRTIRRRGDEMAVGGHSALSELVTTTAARLRSRLASEPEDRSLVALKGVFLTLDDYLAGRLVELVVHTDDLAVSLELPTPEFSRQVYRTVIEVLIDTSRERHGDLAIVRAMTRRERDEINALRVF